MFNNLIPPHFDTDVVLLTGTEGAAKREQLPEGTLRAWLPKLSGLNSITSTLDRVSANGSLYATPLVEACSRTHIQTYIHPSIHPYFHPTIHTDIHPSIHTYIHTYPYSDMIGTFLGSMMVNACW